MPHPLVVNFNAGRSRYDVYVGRRTFSGIPGPWGNKYVIGRDGSRADVVAKHRADVMANPELCARIRRELRGKVLACYCAPLACHADTLAEVANSEEPFSCAEFDGCTENYCAYPGEEHCALAEAPVDSDRRAMGSGSFEDVDVDVDAEERVRDILDEMLDEERGGEA